jgi:thiamine biosynthesis lipoprotein
MAGVELADGECIMTSGDYERRFEHEGEHYHHLLDSRTGRPARGAISVTVIARNCARADAAATALFIAGEEQWPRVAAAMAVEQVMRVAPDGSVALTPAMANRLRFTAQPPRVSTRALP